ncbi:NTP transferase domain-containing protein [Thermaerobacter sp. PB12/4term]|uniref:mannose-1-phosphate guanylyltransferase n=1 Tax=Thermaerobacter sp. PB12/4term TaxID=2293838 RepID=UPI000E328155|nr:sugar phosphate nucleotidyltransferase [Thermaerobacter sp. PB12/4term]QIA26669.1 NTP transferase domain-containing protein [Thermaerobacter sp. PB12/4term]
MPGLPRVAVILAGGEGRRLWPASTPRRPKQFLRLFGGRTLLEATWERARAVPGVVDVWVVTGAPYVELTRHALPELPTGHLVIEPSAKNTAPALALAAGLIARRYGDAAVLVLPADHYVSGVGAFTEAADRALAAAAACDGLVTFGIEPTRPETQYGYVELDEPALAPGAGPFRVRRFVEKPGPEQAAAFLASGRYLWNSGMFAWQNAIFLSELERVVPELARLAARVAAGEPREAWATVWEALPSISVDYAVLERARRILCIRAGFAWDDLGSWLAVDRHGIRDEHGNVVLGTAPAVVQGSSGVTVLTEELPAVVMGVRDLVLAATRDGVLVAGKDSIEGLRQALGILERKLQELARGGVGMQAPAPAAAGREPR